MLDNILSNKKSIRDIIFNAELNSASIGVSTMELLEKYADEMRDSNPNVSMKILSIAREMQAGKKRWDAYEGVIDADVLKLLKMAEEKSIPSEKIITGYVPIKTITHQYNSTIRRNLIFPIVGALLITTILGYVVMKFKGPIDDGMVKVPEAASFVAEYYYHINISVIVFFAFLLFFIPHKLPMLKAVFLKLDSMLALAITRTMLQVGYASAEIIPILKNQFKSKAEPSANSVDGLIELLRYEKFIKPEEAAEIKITVTQDDPIKPIDRFIKQRQNDSEEMTKEAGKAVSTFTLLLTSIPIITMLIVMMNFLSGAADVATAQ